MGTSSATTPASFAHESSMRKYAGKPRCAKVSATCGSRSWAQAVKPICSARSTVEIQKPTTSPLETLLEAFVLVEVIMLVEAVIPLLHQAPAPGRRRSASSRILRPHKLAADRDGSRTAPCEHVCRPPLEST